MLIGERHRPGISFSLKTRNREQNLNGLIKTERVFVTTYGLSNPLCQHFSWSIT